MKIDATFFVDRECSLDLIRAPLSVLSSSNFLSLCDRARGERDEGRGARTVID